MFHTFGYAGTKTDSTANEAAPAVSDQTLTRTANGNQYLLPYDCTIAGAIAYNDTITRARLNYPSIRDFGLPEIYPLNVVADATQSPRYCWWGDLGPKVKKTEEFGLDSSNGASTVDTILAGVWAMVGRDGVPPGRRTTVRGTSAQTLVANAWTTGTITLDQTLPFGRYAIIGMQCTVPDAFLARLVFTNQNQFRPGCPVTEAITYIDERQTFRAGNLGLWGTFEQTSPPQLELLGHTAGAETAAVILDLVQVN